MSQVLRAGAEMPKLLKSQIRVVRGVPFELKWQEVELEGGYKSITFSSSVPNHVVLHFSPNTISLEAIVPNFEVKDEKTEPIAEKSADTDAVDEISEAILMEPLISDFHFASDSQSFDEKCFSQPLTSTSDADSEPKPTNKEIATGRAILQTNEAGQLIQTFPCPSCPKVFGTNSMLNRHLVIHEGDFTCSCGVRYRSKTALTKHQIEVHSLTSPRYTPLKKRKSSSSDNNNNAEPKPETAKRLKKVPAIQSVEYLVLADDEDDPSWFY